MDSIKKAKTGQRKTDQHKYAPCQCIESEEQAKFFNERLTDTEEQFSKLYSYFNAYILKTSRLRDATDDIALALNELAVNEKINKSTKKQVLLFSDLLATLNDLRDNKIQQLQSKLINHLSQYNSICRNAKEEVKTLFSAKEKETAKRKHLGKIRNVAPFNRERIVKAEAALSSELESISRAQKDLEDHAIAFEKKKIEDTKAVLQEFVLLELAEHAMAIELLSQSFNNLNKIDVKSDLNEFGEILKNSPISLRLLQAHDISAKEDDPGTKPDLPGTPDESQVEDYQDNGWDFSSGTSSEVSSESHSTERNTFT